MTFKTFTELDSERVRQRGFGTAEKGDERREAKIREAEMLSCRRREVTESKGGRAGERERERELSLIHI